jgi:hypothetical protein
VASLYERHVVHNEVGIDPESSSALWTIMMTQPVMRAGGINKRHTFFTDNFYTRPSLAKLLYDCTDGNARVIGTIKITNLKNINRKAMKMAIEELKDAPRGSWILLQVLVENKTDKHADPTVMHKTGIIVYKDKRPVSFFSNDMKFTPPERIMVGSDKVAIKCVRGLAPLKRWLGKERIMRTPIYAPVMVVAYNMFMNSVDRFDQLRATVPGIRRETRVSTSMFAFIVDVCVHNAHAVSKEIGGEKRKLKDFKMDLALALLKSAGDGTVVVNDAQVQGNDNLDVEVQEEQERNIRTIAETATDAMKATLEGLGCNASPHQLVEMQDYKPGRCFLCSLEHGQAAKKPRYGCLACKKAFHVNCFAQYHSTALGVGHTIAVDVVNTAVQLPSKKRAFSSISKLIPAVNDVAREFKVVEDV